jgi:hypothetical protein
MFEVGSKVTVSSSDYIRFKEPFEAEVTEVYPSLWGEGMSYSVKGEAIRIRPDDTEETAGGWGNVPEGALSVVKPAAEPKPSKAKTEE